MVSPKSNRRWPWQYDGFLYRRRNEVERLSASKGVSTCLHTIRYVRRHLQSSHCICSDRRCQPLVLTCPGLMRRYLALGYKSPIAFDAIRLPTNSEAHHSIKASPAATNHCTGMRGAHTAPSQSDRAHGCGFRLSRRSARVGTRHSGVDRCPAWPLSGRSHRHDFADG